jgi:hypothetical protein
MFYRPGGGTRYINPQYDMVYVDYVGGVTGWLPVARGNWVAVNACRASINFMNASQSDVTKMAVAPECIVLLEQKQFGGQKDAEAWPIDQWQNLVVATGRRVNMDGWWRLRLTSLNTLDGNGVAMALQVNRTGDSGVDV